jgi:hypothetical protein
MRSRSEFASSCLAAPRAGQRGDGLLDDELDGVRPFGRIGQVGDGQIAR